MRNARYLQSDDYLDAEIDQLDTLKPRSGELSGVTLLKTHYSLLAGLAQQTKQAHRETEVVTAPGSVPSNGARGIFNAHMHFDTFRALALAIAESRCSNSRE